MPVFSKVKHYLKLLQVIWVLFLGAYYFEISKHVANQMKMETGHGIYLLLLYL